MDEILKRLEIIKSALSLNDDEIVSLQLSKLQTLNLDETTTDIVANLKSMQFAKASDMIEEYLKGYSNLVIYEDRELSSLKMELKSLEKELQKLSEERNEYQNIINEFNINYNLLLGKLIRGILKIKKEIESFKLREKDNKLSRYEKLKEIYDEIEDELNDKDIYDDDYEELKKIYEELKEELKKSEKALEEDSDYQRYKESESAYEEFKDEYEEIVTKERFELDEQGEADLKKLYRKASRLCHPDIVEERFKDEALKIMQELNGAYSQKDLNKVKEILYNLENEIAFENTSDMIEDKEILKVKIDTLREELSKASIEIEELKNDKTVEIIQNGEQDGYFKVLKGKLEQEFDNLQKKLHQHKESEEEVVI